MPGLIAGLVTTAAAAPPSLISAGPRSWASDWWSGEMSCAGVMYQPYSSATPLSAYLTPASTPAPPTPQQGASPPTTSPTAATAVHYPADNSLTPLPLKRELAEKVNCHQQFFVLRSTRRHSLVPGFMFARCYKVWKDTGNAFLTATLNPIPSDYLVIERECLNFKPFSLLPGSLVCVCFIPAIE